MAASHTTALVAPTPFNLVQAGVTYSGGKATPAPVLLRDVNYGGKGRIFGTVDRKGTPANVPLRRRVRLHRDLDGVAIRETWSDATTGEFSFAGIDQAQRYTTIAYDYEHNFRAVAADNLTPEVQP